MGPRPEVKWKDFNDEEVITASSPTWTNLYIHQAVFSQGTSKTTIVGEKIRMRHLKVQFQIYNDGTASFGEGQMRIIFWVPRIGVDAAYGKAHVAAQTDFNSFFDLDKIKILKDMRITVGSNNDLSNTSLIKSFTMDFKRFRDAKLVTSNNTDWNITDADHIYMGVICTFNNMRLRWNGRLTYVDN